MTRDTIQKERLDLRLRRSTEVSLGDGVEQIL